MGSHTLRGVGDKIELFTRLERPTKMNRGMNSAAALSGVFADWYWETDAELRLTYTSPQFAQTTGLEPADDYFEHNRRTLERHEAFRDFEIQRRTRTEIWCLRSPVSRSSTQRASSRATTV